MARTIALNLLFKTLGLKNVKDAHDAIDQLQGRMDKFGKRAAMGSGMIATAGAATQLTGALLPVAASAGALPGIFAAVQTATLTAKVAFMGMGDAMSAVAEGDAKKLEAAMKDLAPAAKEVVRTGADVFKTFKDIRKSTQQKMFTGVAGPMREVASNLAPSVKRGMGDVATEMNKAGKEALRFGSSPLARGVLSSIFKTTSKVIHEATSAVKPFLSGIAQGVKLSLPFAQRLSMIAVNGAKTGAAFMNSKRGMEAFQSVVNTGVNRLITLGKIIKNVTVGVFSMFRQVRTDGGSLLTTIEGLTAKFTAWAKTAKGQQQVASAFKFLSDVTKQIVAILPLFLSPLVQVAKLLTQLPEPVRGFAVNALAVTAVVGPLAGKIMGVVKAMAAMQIASKLSTIATKVWTAAVWLFNAAIRANPIGIAITAIMALIGVLVLAYNKSADFRQIVQAAWAAIKTAVATAWNGVIKPAFASFRQWIVTELGPRLIWFHKSVVIPVWNGIKTAISIAWNIIKIAFDVFKFYLTKVLAPAFMWLWKNVITPAWNGISLAIKIAWNIIKIAFDVLKFYLTKVLAPAVMWLWKNVITPAWRAISAVIKVAWAIIKIIFDAIKFYIQRVLGPIFQWLWKTIIKPVFDFVWKHISSVWNSKIKPVFDRIMNMIKTTVPNAFKVGVNLIKGFWDKILNIAKTPVNFVIRLYNQGVGKMINKLAEFVGSNARVPAIPYFAKGGVLPGYSPGQDSMIAAVSPGESIFRPEFTKAVGPGFVQEANQKARTGGPDAVKRWLSGSDQMGGEGMAFAKGGVVPGFAGSFGFGGIIGKFIQGVKDFTIGNVEKGAKTLMDKIFSAGIPANGPLKTLFSAIPTWIKDKVLAWVKDKVSFGGGGPGVGKGVNFARAQAGKPYVWGGVGPGGYDCSGFMSAILNVIQGKNPYQRRFSTRSFGASSGPGGFVRGLRSGFMVGVTNAGVGHMAGTLGGKLNVESRGSRGVVVGSGARGFNDGLFTHQYGLKFDRGGILPVGTSLVHNGTGQPEAVFTSRQMSQIGTGNSDIHVDTINIYGVEDVGDMVKKIQKYAADRGGIKLKTRN